MKIRAAVLEEFGAPLEVQELELAEPQAGEVLIRVHAAGVLPADWKIRQGLFGSMFAPAFPYIPGSAIAGVVEQVGPGVSALSVGQAVFGRSTNGASSAS